jgi:hypothetical protein
MTLKKLLVPNLQIGNAGVFETLFRPARQAMGIFKFHAAGKRSFRDKCVPNLEIGNEEKGYIG